MITRCRLRAQQRAARIKLDGPSFAELQASFPEACPHTDCSVGAACRSAVRDVLVAAWVQRNASAKKARP